VRGKGCGEKDGGMEGRRDPFSSLLLLPSSLHPSLLHPSTSPLLSRKLASLTDKHRPEIRTKGALKDLHK